MNKYPERLEIDMPGNYPGDLYITIDQSKTAASIGDALKSSSSGEPRVMMLINLRNCGELCSTESDTRSMFFVISEFLDKAAAMVEHEGGSYVNKFLGDGLLAYFGEEEDPVELWRASQELRHSLGYLKQRIGSKNDKAWHLAMTCLLMDDSCVIGVVGNRVYRDYTVMGQNLFKAFRLMDWIDVDTTLVSEGLRDRFKDSYVAVETFPSRGTPRFYSIFREKTSSEKHSGILERCADQCSFYAVCRRAYDLGTFYEPDKPRKPLDCHECRNDFREPIWDGVPCWNWDHCRTKVEWREGFERSWCCSACERHIYCFHSYCLARSGAKMISCLR